MRIETPENFNRMDAADKQLTIIENRIASLAAEIDKLNNQLQQEKWFFRKRKLKERKRKLEDELNLARFYEEQTAIMIFKSRSE